MTLHTFTLSRAHKLTERLTRERDQVFQDIATAVEPMTVNVMGEENRASEGQAEFSRLLKLVASLGTAKDVIRQAIAAENSRVGIHACLFKKADLHAEIRAYEGLLNASSYSQGSAIDKDSVVPYMSRISNMTSMHTVKVKVMTEDMKQELVRKIAALKREADRVSDDINDLNSHKISVEIDADVAEIIGL
jgi:hypothetical protein